MSTGPLPEEGGEGAEQRYPLARPPTRHSLLGRFWQISLVRVGVYYLALIGIAIILIRVLPIVKQAWVTPMVPAIAEGAALVGGHPSAAPPPPTITTTTIERTLTTLIVVLGAVALAIPVAWVYMITKRLRYDPGLVRSVIILPIAVAGILLVVKNSLALAFSLAGIVAAVRFRNTLKDPQDAVYIFLTIAIGISAGVQALDIALVVSFLFNLFVLLLWKFQVGSIYGGSYGRTGVLSIGDSALLVAQSAESRRSLRRHLLERAEAFRGDGVLLIHTNEPELTRHTIADALGQSAEEWNLLGMVPRGSDIYTAEYLVRLQKNETPADLIGALDEWSSHVLAAEYVPFRTRERLQGSPAEE